LVVLHETEGRLPERRVEVYYRLSELLIDRWTRTRSAAHHARGPSRGTATRVLGPLAWWIVERGAAPVLDDEQVERLVPIESRLYPEEAAQADIYRQRLERPEVQAGFQAAASGASPTPTPTATPDTPTTTTPEYHAATTATARVTVVAETLVEHGPACADVAEPRGRARPRVCVGL